VARPRQRRIGRRHPVDVVIRLFTAVFMQSSL
jgi:hypothetical protein